MSTAPLNTDLPSSYKIPGARFKIYYTGGAPGVENLAKRLLLMAYMGNAGAYGQDSPVQVLSQDDVNQKFVQGSDLARLYAAAVSQVGGGVIDIFCVGIKEPTAGSGAVQSTYLVTFSGSWSTIGSIDCWICGYKTSVAVGAADTPTIVGAALAAAINLLPDIPVTAGAASGAVTLTYRHRGIVGEDLPVRVNVNNASGCKASCGTVTFTGTASGIGSAKLTIGGTTITTAIANSDSPTTVAGNLVLAINGGNYPVTATNVAGVVTLFYAADRDVRRVKASIVTSTVITVTVDTVVAGVGTPSLTASLTNIGAAAAFPIWCTSFIDTTSLGTLSNHIELYSNGLYQKSQFLHFGSVSDLATAGAIPPAPSPALTASPRYEESWVPDGPQQAYEYASRKAAAMCKEDYIGQNWDGYPLQTRGSVPLLLPHLAVRPSDDDMNSALRSYFMTPIYVAPTNRMTVMRSATTFSTSDEIMQDPSSVRQLDNIRLNCATRINLLFGGKNLKVNGTPQTPNTFNIADVRDAIIVLLGELDKLDLFDGVDAWKASVTVAVDPLVPTRLDVGVPGAVVRCYHGTAGTVNKVS